MSAVNLSINYNFYIFINNLIVLLMDKGPLVSPQRQNFENEQKGQENQNPSSGNSQEKVAQENKVGRRPGRPPLRIKGRPKNSQKNHFQENDNDEDFQQEKPKLKDKIHSVKDEKENNMDGFLRIIDYLKKIQCDEASLHNKMNPFNLLTPTCYWYMICAEYFSFDFFNSKSPHEIALQILKRAQKTPITLPMRIIKPLKIKVELEFQTPQLCELAVPITQKLTSLIPINFNILPQTLEKSSSVTSIGQDNYFRSSTRAIVYNWISKKISSSDKWNSTIKTKLEHASRLNTKQFSSRVLECRVAEVKHQQLDVAPQIYNRQRKLQKSIGESKLKKGPKKPVLKGKKNNKKQQQDQIYDESDQQIKKSQLNQQMIDENALNQEVVAPLQKEQEDIKAEEMKQQLLKQQNDQLKNEQVLQSDSDEELEEEDKHHEIITFSKTYREQDLLLQSILHLPLDSIISILKSSIQPIRLPQITRPYMPIPKNDPLQLVYQVHPQEEIFLDYMRDRQQKMYIQKESHSQMALQQKERQGQVEDAKCQVCTDGDYTDDNLIVFCSMCNISLHQRCVGLAKVPADNWVCEVCASFGPAGINVPCPLCHVKGGALKRTSIHINTPLFKDTNPEYHQFAKKCPNYKHKQEYFNQNASQHKGHNKGEDELQPYYDYFSKATYPLDQPVCHFVWVHYVCTIWIPECYFQQKNGLINIKGIENIDKKRFKERCLVCKQVKAGACVKCDNQHCNKHYHPQCARKKRIYMEQLNLDKLKYLIFCQAHQPLKVKRKIEVKRKKQRDEIVKFCRGIQKYVETYKIANLPFKLLKIGLNQPFQQNKLEKKDNKTIQSDQKISIKIQKNTDEDFIKSVIDGLIRQNQIVVNLSVIGRNRYKVDQIIKPSKRDMRKSLTRQDEFWKNFKSTESPQTNLKRFNTIMRQNNYLREKIDNFINFGSNPEQKIGKDDKKNKKNSGRRRKQKVETVIEQQGAIFCVCRRPYQGEQEMFECEVCNQWYHYQCIGFIGTEEDAQGLVFHCMKCLKYQLPQVKRELLQKCSKFFSEDSLFLNYRPPTPSLQSQEESQSVRNNYVNQNRKQNCSQFKQFTVQMQIHQKDVKQKKVMRTLHDYFRQIEDQTINLEKPFIIFDPFANKGHILHRQYIDEEPDEHMPDKHSQSEQVERISEAQNKQMSQENINCLKKSGQNEQQRQQPSEKQDGYSNNNQKSEQKIEKNQSKSVSEPELQNLYQRLPSNSSQLMTPFFASHSFSFGGDQNAKLNSKGNINNPQQMQKQILFQDQPNYDNKVQNENENLSNKEPPHFHFNRMQVEKLKSTIEQNQKYKNEQQNEGENFHTKKTDGPQSQV